MHYKEKIMPWTHHQECMPVLPFKMLLTIFNFFCASDLEYINSKNTNFHWWDIISILGIISQTFKFQNDMSHITIFIWKTEPSLGRWKIFGIVSAFSFCNLRVIVSNTSCWTWNRLDFMLYKFVLFCELNLL